MKIFKAYQIFMCTIALIGILRITLGLILGDLNNVSFYQY